MLQRVLNLAQQLLERAIPRRPEDVARDAEAAATAAATRALDQHLERWRQDWTPHYRQLMAQARLDAPAQPLVIAEIQAGRHDIFYSYDSLRTGEESIGVVRRVKTTWWMMDLTGDRRVLERLGRQPIGRSWLSPPRAEPWVLRQLEATATRSSAKTPASVVVMLDLHADAWIDQR